MHASTCVSCRPYVWCWLGCLLDACTSVSLYECVHVLTLNGLVQAVPDDLVYYTVDMLTVLQLVSCQTKVCSSDMVAFLVAVLRGHHAPGTATGSTLQALPAPVELALVRLFRTELPRHTPILVLPTTHHTAGRSLDLPFELISYIADCLPVAALFARQLEVGSSLLCCVV